MDKSIESIWKEGAANENLMIPKIENLYNQKSISYVEKVIDGFKREVFLLIPIAVLIFVFNILLDNDYAVFWGIVCAVPCLIWFLLGKYQIRSLVNLDYKSNSYEYLISVRDKMNAIRKFNKRLAISGVPIIIFPLLVYTYFKQQGKTIGEIMGVEGLEYPMITIFLLAPILTLFGAVIVELQFRKETKKLNGGIDNLIREIEELRT